MLFDSETKDIGKSDDKESHNNTAIYVSVPTISACLATALCVIVPSFYIGKGVELDKIMKLQHTKEITNPYHGFNPKADISKVNAEEFLLDMDKGEQFSYRGKIITLLKRIDDKEPTNTGYTDYFMIGNQINMINTSNLNAKTIDQVFGK